ncbi:beta-N-acetylglucosaminidase domain-containing protein [Streptomyces sp. NPDC093109]|uniref:beta-N-acetylhexosaminidase family protein n=1 Tax=Streptomyces sp. NPDC093109 TaxID=3154977 RepID=UPI00344E4345
MPVSSPYDPRPHNPCPSVSHPRTHPRTRRRSLPRLRTLSVLALAVALLGALAAPAGAAGGGRPGPSAAHPAGPAGLPVVTPTPQSMTAIGAGVPVPRTVRLLVGAETDGPARDLVVSVLGAAGARVEIVDTPVTGRPAKAPLTVVLGTLAEPRVARALRAAGATAPAELPAEGYRLAVPDKGPVVLAGQDAAGTYYAAQTLRQLVAGGRIAGVLVTDHPSMALRGTIEGFYGSPWSHRQRMDQLAFYGDVKMNTYIYAPKDDPYHREQWRDPYPADRLALLGELVRQATAHHVRFTFAVSPGVSICYSDPADVRTLDAKLQALYALGVRSFSVPLDDISYTSWNCAADRAAYGAPSAGAAARAQVDLLNHVQREFLDAREGTRPLQMVPTEYSDLADSAYKTTIREQLDPRVEIMWTGTDVVPPSITVSDARRAASVWGRKVFVWDNYPVNDYGQATGRLLMAPYEQREAGLHETLSGIVLNPMNQADASKVAEFGGASFTWNDLDYDPVRTWRAAAGYLAGGDPATVTALLAFFDTQYLAPTFGDLPWQPQAPALAARLAGFRTAWAAGDRAGALRTLRPYAGLLASASATIRSGTDPGLVTDTGPWLDALALWGAAFNATLDGLAAGEAGDGAAARGHFARSSALAAQAAAIRTLPGTTRPQGTVKVADTVLDVFLRDAPGLLS